MLECTNIKANVAKCGYVCNGTGPSTCPISSRSPNILPDATLVPCLVLTSPDHRLHSSFTLFLRAASNLWFTVGSRWTLVHVCHTTIIKLLHSVRNESNKIKLDDFLFKYNFFHASFNRTRRLNVWFSLWKKKKN